MLNRLSSKLLASALLLAITLHIVAIDPVSAQIIGIGESPQANPFEANPAFISQMGWTNPWNALDRFLYSYTNSPIGSFPSGYLELRDFATSPTSFNIGWVDFKISYRSQATIDDKYRIVYYVNPSPTAVVLQDWVSGPMAKFDLINGYQAHRPWHNQPEPNDGVWSWDDINRIRVRIETARVGTMDAGQIYVYEVWVTVYEGTLPPEAPGKAVFSMQPPQVVGLSAESLFFVDVFVGCGAPKMWGYEIRIDYDTSVLTFLDTFNYHPFNYQVLLSVDEEAGYVYLAYGTYLGDANGFTGRSPIVRIYFLVDSTGISTLRFTTAHAVDVFGTHLTVETQEGFFSNVPIIVINPDGSIDPPSAPIQREGDLYQLTANIYTNDSGIVIWRDNATLDGANHIVKGVGTYESAGIGILDATNVTVKNVTIEYFDYGIVCNVSSQFHIYLNNVANNNYGIWLGVSSYGDIWCNDVRNNIYGMWVGYDSSSSVIWHNNFANEVNVILDGTTVNAWNQYYPVGGNYWSDYIGIDEFKGPNQDIFGSDGFGDTPFVLDDNNQDNYPLMGPMGWNSPTRSGENVTVFPTEETSLTFESVTREGYTRAKEFWGSPPPPPGRALVGPYCDIKTTAYYSGVIVIRVIYDDSGLTPEQEGGLQLTHWLLFGDVTGETPNPYEFVSDGKVDIKDIAIIAKHFGKDVPPAPPECDISSSTVGMPDGKIDIRDIALAAKNFGKTAQPVDITTYIDTESNIIYGETDHLSIIGVTKQLG